MLWREEHLLEILRAGRLITGKGLRISISKAGLNLNMEQVP